MEKYNDILIIGLGVSGKAAVTALSKLKIKVYAYDDNIKNISQIPEDISNLGIDFLFSPEMVMDKKFKLVMKSPGINPNHILIQNLKNAGAKIISDLELGYKYKGDEKLICITGTNGKTTTTVLVNDILNSGGISSNAVGNIGVGAVFELINTTKDFLVIECSSFQLDDVDLFKPNISVIMNITSDHLDYHGTTENYKNAKLNILKNLNKKDYAVLNFDDKNLKELRGDYNKIFISTLEKIESGVYLYDGKIFISEKGVSTEYLDTKDIYIKGVHNYYNIMASIAVAEILKLDREIVKETIQNFQGVPHRLQFVRLHNGVSYYNDSKGTNSDSTMKAIASFDNPLIIFLGGYDKKEDFTELLNMGKDKIKAILAIGQTKDQVVNKALELGYKNIYEIDNLEEGINIASKISQTGDVVLLSPACASWGMFKNFEERGNKFIQLVEELK
ncbi:MAG: UDP-N-acetylmuramoyl-L-alanine--D-glutamate ligase [Tissierellia bacterium]|nr:UDP-N-acetylmuramoyl-L-alanine--D-glutamate ligase [Tissierellia bacterium]